MSTTTTTTTAGQKELWGHQKQVGHPSCDYIFTEKCGNVFLTMECALILALYLTC